MRTSALLKRNLIYFWRTNLAVIAGVAIAVAVLAGALLVGDSVRASLRDLFLQRLGSTSHVVSAQNFFREQLAYEMQADGRFAADGFGATCPLIVLEGSVTHEESGRRGMDVLVYGVDERFWKFHGSVGQPPSGREILISPSLAEELKAASNDALLLRVVKPSDISIESLHGRKDDAGRTLRLTLREALPASALGEFSIRPQQTSVRAVFVPLQLLQKDLEQEGKANTVLVSAKQSETKPDSLQKILKDKISLADMGVSLRALQEQGSLSLETESAVINDALAETAHATATEMGMRVAPVNSYLANSIRAGEREIPYSIVTAIDDERFAELRTAGEPTPLILNEWAANDLGAKTGDEVTLEYYLWQPDGSLKTQSAQFRLAGIVPIKGAAADRDLVPEYPGITQSESISDWDPPFPVDLSRIRKQDEDYWRDYRTTPKAFIPLSKGQELWGTRFGKLTSMRLIPPDVSQLQTALESFQTNLRAKLNPAEMNFVVYPARAEGIEASRGATNFGEYFLYFSFFLVVSALMLAALFFKLGVEQRLREIGTLQAIGFPASRIRTLFLAEGFLLSIIGSLLGLLGAVAYGKLMMHGLSTWWVGAVGTTMLRLHISPLSLIIGAAGGVLAALLCIMWTLRTLRRVSTRSLLHGGRQEGGRGEQGNREIGKPKRTRRFLRFPLFPFSPFSLFAPLGLIVIVLAALNIINQVAGFFGGGTLLLVALLCYEWAWLRRGSGGLIAGRGWWPVLRMGFRNATSRPARSVLCISLIASAAFIVVAVDAFRRHDKDIVSDKKSGSGGYALLGESDLPLVYDANTPAGREALNLNAGQDSGELAEVSYTRFRLRPGDDASCLNLYQPREPRMLAATEDFIESNRFAFQDSLKGASDTEKANPWLLLNREFADGAIPVIADANSMTYVLHKKLGEDFVLEQSGGAEPIRLRLVASLSDSLFQSELLMSAKNFLRLFPEIEGYSFFLIDAPASVQLAALSGHLEERLADFGFDAVSTSERIAEFHKVENTYLSTFQMLGGLGLALGTLGLAAVLLRNVLERRRELALLRAVGYGQKHFAAMVIAENAFLLFSGLIIGTACALLAIAPVWFARGGRLPIASLSLLLFVVAVSGLLASIAATMAAIRSPLLPSLRAE
ncbi:MAG: FtsX-like permease family protein [Pyrinomonadaceae bacterium]|nr:FtsX-like permease family protein [Pyrinomonadaceae bacterium]